MKGFIIFFHGAEGTSPLVRLLDNFGEVRILHQINGKGWEPFDQHNCGSLSRSDFSKCLRLIFSESGSQINFNALNSVYAKTARQPLETGGTGEITGFKMRLYNMAYLTRRKWYNRLPLMLKFNQYRHKKLLIRNIKKYNLHVFIAVRQNIFRRALSKYHNEQNDSGKQHLQFKIATGQVDEGALAKVRINPVIFRRYIARCRADIASKKKLYDELKSEGIPVSVIRYEDFLDDPVLFFRTFFSDLGLTVSDATIHEAIGQGTTFRKVHGDNISSFVINNEEILEEFGKEFVEWHS